MFSPRIRIVDYPPARQYSPSAGKNAVEFLSRSFFDETTQIKANQVVCPASLANLPSVTLDGSGSSDQSGDPITFSWESDSGDGRAPEQHDRIGCDLHRSLQEDHPEIRSDRK